MNPTLRLLLAALLLIPYLIIITAARAAYWVGDQFVMRGWPRPHQSPTTLSGTNPERNHP